MRVFRIALAGAGLAASLAALALHQPAAAKADGAAQRQTQAVADGSSQAAPDLFGTVATPIRAERFAREWERASKDATGHPVLQRMVAPARRLAPQQQVAFIQAAVHRQIRWISDATQWGRHDYWASAAETLARGAGDMEDRAIVKMQGLRALGFRKRDLYLTLGRDKVGGPMTVLIVRAGNRHYVLDDLGGDPVATDLREGFRPVLSFGRDNTWVHGYRSAKAEPGSAAVAVAAPN